MNWDKFQRTKTYYLLPLAVWWGMGSFSILSDKNGYLIGIPLFIVGLLVTIRHYKKQKKLKQRDNI